MMIIIYHRLNSAHYRVGENTVVVDANSEDVISVGKVVILLITVKIPIDKVLKAIIVETMTVNNNISC